MRWDEMGDDAMDGDSFLRKRQKHDNNQERKVENMRNHKKEIIYKNNTVNLIGKWTGEEQVAVAHALRDARKAGFQEAVEISETIDERHKMKNESGREFTCVQGNIMNYDALKSVVLRLLKMIEMKNVNSELEQMKCPSVGINIRIYDNLELYEYLQKKNS